MLTGKARQHPILGWTTLIITKLLFPEHLYAKTPWSRPQMNGLLQSYDIPGGGHG